MWVESTWTWYWCGETKIKTLCSGSWNWSGDTTIPALVSCFYRWTCCIPNQWKKLLSEIKCLHTKRYTSPIDVAQDPNFYVNLENGKPVLKKWLHWVLLTNSASNGTFSFDTSDFVVYTSKDLITVSTEFDVSYFDSLIQKLNSFYKKFILPRMVLNLTN